MIERTRHLLCRAALVCVLLAAVTLTACGGGDDGPSDLPPLGRDGTALDAGEYRTTKFTPRTTFEVEEGWATASPELPDYFDIVRDKRAFAAVVFQRITTVVPPKSPDDVVAAPADLVSWLRKHPNLTVGASKKTRVGGRPATQLDVRVKQAVPRKERPDSCDAPCLPLFEPSDGTPVSYAPKDQLRFVVLESRGGQVPVTITIAAPSSDFARFEPQAKKVLSTVKFARG